MEKPSFSPPSEFEALHYYAGIPGPPKLVARLGSAVFEYKTYICDITEDCDMTEDWPSLLKSIYTIGEHALRGVIDKVNEDGTPTLRQEILRAIKPLQWNSLDFIRIGFEEELARPTILIAVSQGTTSMEDAEAALSDVWHACARRGIRDVEIEIFEASSVSAMPVSAMPKEVHEVYLEMSYDDFPKCGTSLGRQVGSGPGTLGCYVRLDGKHAGKYILTNDHVVFLKSDDRPDSRSYYDVSKSKHERVRVDAPAHKDHVNLMNYLEDKRIPDLRRKLKADYDKRLKAELDEIPPLSQETISEMDARIIDLARHLSNHHKLSRSYLPAGSVAFSSGDRTDHNHNRMDWGLVAINPARFGGLRTGFNLFPPGIEYGWATVTASGYSTDAKHRFLPMKEAKVSPLGSLQNLKAAVAQDDGDRPIVFKCGRTTGWTAGKLNAIESNCSRKNSGLVTTEATVINLVGHVAFAGLGDSGSLVFDVDGYIVGLLHTITTAFDEDGAMLTRITPITSVIEDIKLATGATIVEFDV